MNNDNIDKWQSAAYALEAPVEHPGVPHHVLVGEAVDVARFCQFYWEAQTDDAGNVVRPGLVSAARDGAFHEGIAAEILELQDAVQGAQTQYRLAVRAPADPPMGRSGFVLGELKDTLEFHFDDGKLDEDDARLERLADAHEQALSQDAVAAALEDYAALAELHRDDIDGLGGFDAALIDEARRLAAALRERSATALTGEATSASQTALDLRNRLATLLFERMSAVRSAARFVFRNDPDTVRKVTSAYERQRRSASRRRGKSNESDTRSAVDSVEAKPAKSSE